MTFEDEHLIVNETGCQPGDSRLSRDALSEVRLTQQSGNEVSSCSIVKLPGLGWITLNNSTKAEVAGRPRGDVTRPGQPQIGDVFPSLTWVPHPVGDVAHDKST